MDNLVEVLYRLLVETLEDPAQPPPSPSLAAPDDLLSSPARGMNVTL
jgi:hypothetical protein